MNLILIVYSPPPGWIEDILDDATLSSNNESMDEEMMERSRKRERDKEDEHNI
jgi:hypothetical protein